MAFIVSSGGHRLSYTSGKACYKGPERSVGPCVFLTAFIIRGNKKIATLKAHNSLSFEAKNMKSDAIDS